MYGFYSMPCKIGDSYAGVSLIIRDDFEIIKTQEIHKGRIIKIECKNKATKILLPRGAAAKRRLRSGELRSPHTSGIKFLSEG